MKNILNKFYFVNILLIYSSNQTEGPVQSKPEERRCESFDDLYLGATKELKEEMDQYLLTEANKDSFQKLQEQINLTYYALRCLENKMPNRQEKLGKILELVGELCDEIGNAKQVRNQICLKINDFGYKTNRLFSSREQIVNLFNQILASCDQINQLTGIQNSFDEQIKRPIQILQLFRNGYALIRLINQICYKNYVHEQGQKLRELFDSSNALSEQAQQLCPLFANSNALSEQINQLPQLFNALSEQIYELIRASNALNDQINQLTGIQNSFDEQIKRLIQILQLFDESNSFDDQINQLTDIQNSFPVERKKLQNIVTQILPSEDDILKTWINITYIQRASLIRYNFAQIISNDHLNPTQKLDLKLQTLFSMQIMMGCISRLQNPDYTIMNRCISDAYSLFCDNSIDTNIVPEDQTGNKRIQQKANELIENMKKDVAIYLKMNGNIDPFAECPDKSSLEEFKIYYETNKMWSMFYKTILLNWDKFRLDMILKFDIEEFNADEKEFNEDENTRRHEAGHVVIGFMFDNIKHYFYKETPGVYTLNSVTNNQLLMRIAKLHSALGSLASMLINTKGEIEWVHLYEKIDGLYSDAQNAFWHAACIAQYFGRQDDIGYIRFIVLQAIIRVFMMMQKNINTLNEVTKSMPEDLKNDTKIFNPSEFMQHGLQKITVAELHEIMSTLYKESARLDLLEKRRRKIQACINTFLYIQHWLYSKLTSRVSMT